MGLLYGDPDAAGEIGGVAIHDPYEEQHYPEHAIVLGVGVHGADEIGRLLRHLAALGATALVVRAGDEFLGIRVGGAASRSPRSGRGRSWRRPSGRSPVR